jgi:hypothetical protein
MMRVMGLALTEKFLPKGAEHSSAAIGRGKAVRRGKFGGESCRADLFFVRLWNAVERFGLEKSVPNERRLSFREKSGNNGIAFGRRRV